MAELKAEQNKKGKGGLIAVIIIAVIIVAILIGVIIFLLKTPRDAEFQGGEERRNVLVTADNAEEVVEQMIADEDEEKVAPGYYTVTMNTTWNFPDGDKPSSDAVVENVSSNLNDVYFDIFLEEDESHVIYKSPVIPLGGSLREITLDEDLEKGVYPCVVEYHLIDENQKTISTVRVGLNVVIEN